PPGLGFAVDRRRAVAAVIRPIPEVEVVLDRTRRVEHRLGAPAAGAEILPGTEVVCDPADRGEPVHRRTAAEAAAAAVRDRLLAARADRARAVPVERGGARLRGLERQAEALRAVAKLDRGVGGPIIGAGFQQED